MSEPVSPAPGPAHNRRPFVLTMIGLAALLFLATEMLLYLRWSAVREPTCVLIVRTSEPLRGALVEVDGLMLPKSLKATVGEQGRFNMPFYLDPGNYRVRVSINDEVQFQANVSIPRPRSGMEVDLTRVIPTTTPTTRLSDPPF